MKGKLFGLIGVFALCYALVNYLPTAIPYQDSGGQQTAHIDKTPNGGHSFDFVFQDQIDFRLALPTEVAIKGNAIKSNGGLKTKQGYDDSVTLRLRPPLRCSQDEHIMKTVGLDKRIRNKHPTLRAQVGDIDEKETFWGFLKKNWGELIAGFLAFVEVIIRLTPTQKDNTILTMVKRAYDFLIGWLIPNKKLGGGTH